VALAEEATDDAGRALLGRVLGDPTADAAALDAVRDLMRSTGALERVEDRITTQTATAREAIAEAPVLDDARAALDALAVAATTRTT
jgi:geranylgeranyl diphosphate synthase type I